MRIHCAEISTRSSFLFASAAGGCCHCWFREGVRKCFINKYGEVMCFLGVEYFPKTSTGKFSACFFIYYLLAKRLTHAFCSYKQLDLVFYCCIFEMSANIFSMLFQRKIRNPSRCHYVRFPSTNVIAYFFPHCRSGWTNSGVEQKNFITLRFVFIIYHIASRNFYIILCF